MCDGNYEKDPAFVASYRRVRYDRYKATYYLRGRYRKIGGKKCVYCGFDADTGDHVPSLFAGYTNGVEKELLFHLVILVIHFWDRFPQHA